MRAFINLDNCEFIVSPTLTQRVNTHYFTRRDYVPVEIQFCRAGSVVELPDGATGRIGVKKAFAGGFLAYDSGWSKTGSGTNTVYTFALNFNTSELDAEFPLDTEEAIEAKIEVEWVAEALTSSTMPATAVIYNDVIRGDEALPSLATTLTDIEFSDGSGGVWRLAIDPSGSVTTTKVG